jgi:hypothetical protein
MFQIAQNPINKKENKQKVYKKQKQKNDKRTFQEQKMPKTLNSNKTLSLQAQSNG